MKKNLFLLGAAVLATALFFTACPGTTGPETENYKVTTIQPDNGTIEAAPSQGPFDTPVKIWASPRPGYRLTELKANGSAIDITILGPWEITLKENVTLTAKFEVLADNVYSVSIDSLQNGHISAEPQYGPEGTDIGLKISPNSGYGYGNLKYRKIDGTGSTLISGSTFKLPGYHVIVSADFTKLDTTNVDTMINAGTDALLNGNLSYAIETFESAYQQNKGSEKAIVYSSLAKLASIANDENVRKLMRERLGFTNYPGTIDSLISGAWLQTYTEKFLVYSYYDNGKNYIWQDPDDDSYFFTSNGLEPKAGYYYVDWDWDGDGNIYKLGSEIPRYDDYYAERLPGLDLPDWFKESDFYGGITGAGTLNASAWPMLLFANLIDKNQNGLNDLLDDVLSSVFGRVFEDAAARFKDLKYDQVVKVDQRFIQAFNLTNILSEGDTYVGKAELDILFSAVRLFKASLEWVAAYNWDTDISFLRTDWGKLDSIPKGSLPLVSNFMKNRNSGMMTNSKNDFIRAINDTISAYEHLIGKDSKLPLKYINEMKKFRWISDGLSKLRTAIEKGESFYVKESSGNSYDNTPENALFGINTGKLFTPGQFAIDQLIETESGGKAPKFYGFKENAPPAAINGENAFENYDEVGFNIKYTRIKEVILPGLELELPTVDTAVRMFPAPIGQIIYGLYHN